MYTFYVIFLASSMVKIRQAEISRLPDDDQLEDLEGDKPHPAVIGAARGGQLDHLLHQQLIVEHNLETIV